LRLECFEVYIRILLAPYRLTFILTIYIYMCVYIYIYIQGDSGGGVNILGGDSNVIVRKKVHTHMCPILNVYRDRAL
jgi:hypothetical protein